MRRGAKERCLEGFLGWGKDWRRLVAPGAAARFYDVYQEVSEPQDDNYLCE